MSIPVLTFFNNKGGVGKTSLVYHMAWMFSEMGKRIVAIDLDPQANLTSAFLPEDQLEALWDEDTALEGARTVYQCVRPLTEVGDIREPEAKQINSRLCLIPGDLGLAGFEDFLSQEWPNCFGSGARYRPFRVLTAFWQVSQLAAKQHNADLILADVGPNLGAINRSALIGSNHVVIPLAADLFSLQGLRNLGPTLRAWRSDWQTRVANWSQPAFELPTGSMQPVGYIVQQHTERLSRPVKAYDKWAARIPSVYRSSVLDEPPEAIAPESDAYCLARLKHYRSLVPMAQEVRKPIFQLSSADGAIGSHSYAVTEARTHFRALAKTILGRIEVLA
ncbi:MAG: chromosome partitioning protein [Gammaproteobacteria bacterium RIFCSPLOWO2_02_FULL_61_13]|nr:MAG: chromosome partitioning protein [Gammaproteobacteria bacterium RIFCSPLOWO2_02_FULL_61_13]